MMLVKSFTSLLFLAYLISIVLAQTPSTTATATAIETNNSTSIAPTTTAGIITNETESRSASTEPTASSTTPLFTSTAPTNAVPTVQSNGFNSNGNSASPNQQSWLRQHNRFVFIIFVGLLFLALIIWYIVRSVKGMRKRLEQENQAQLYMMQQASAPHPPPQQQQPQYQQQGYVPELTETPPPAYKTEENTPSHPPGQSHY
jgi:hypothetical protein